MNHFTKRNIFQMHISFQLEDLYNYTEMMEEVLHKKVDDFNGWFETKAKGMSEEDINEMGEYYSDEYHSLARTNPTLFRSSSMISIYTCLEINFKQICQHIQRRINPSHKLLPRKVYIHHCRDFLINHRIVEERFFKESIEWNLINSAYREIRNSFAHNQGRMKEQKYATIEDSIRLLQCSFEDGTNEVKLEKAFCFEFIQTIETFFETLFAEIDLSLFRTPKK